MADGSIIGAIWQTGLTWWRDFRRSHPKPAKHRGRQVRGVCGRCKREAPLFRSPESEDGWPLRCRSCVQDDGAALDILGASALGNEKSFFDTRDDAGVTLRSDEVRPGSQVSLTERMRFDFSPRTMWCREGAHAFVVVDVLCDGRSQLVSSCPALAWQEAAPMYCETILRDRILVVIVRNQATVPARVRLQLDGFKYGA